MNSGETGSVRGESGGCTMGQGEKNCGFSVPGGGKSNLNWKMFKLSRAGFLNGDVEKKKKE